MRWTLRGRACPAGQEPDAIEARTRSPRDVLELWQRLEPFLGTARQAHLLVGELQGVVRDDNQASSHTQEATYRQNGIRLLAVEAHQEIANLADGFVGIVDD